MYESDILHLPKSFPKIFSFQILQMVAGWPATFVAPMKTSTNEEIIKILLSQSKTPGKVAVRTVFFNGCNCLTENVLNSMDF